MKKVKIISNPYKKEVCFQSFDEKLNQWVDLKDENAPLLKLKYVRGFFPFNVKEILDQIIETYRIKDEWIHLIFEGTSDEFKELENLVANEPYNQIIELEYSSRYIENARDIFPDIIKVFEENINPLILELKVTEKIKNELDKYQDVTKDVIPICVLGNYSSGKSSFINALIGSEILPSGAEPMTAKIFKISQSAHEDRARIYFDHNNQDVTIKFLGDVVKFEGEDLYFLSELQEELNGIEDRSIPLLVNTSIAFLNSLDGDMISDTVEIEIPFVAGLWKEQNKRYVIFDTPGSNSASNKNHHELLQEALQGFSNGLPIYVSEFDKLDSTDNENLFKEIDKLNELDDRFTMIVVNKADAASLDPGEFKPATIRRILNQSIPKNLYKGGIYFVSSIIGLGSKSNGEFIDFHYADIFDEKQKKFEDESSRFYKSLYIYNIMPEQLKEKCSKDAYNLPDKLWANSGLYSVERDIETFANKYSSYNKCQQAKLFLDKIIDTTSKQIDITKINRQAIRDELADSLEKDRKELINQIYSDRDERLENINKKYPAYMDTKQRETLTTFSYDEISKLESVIHSEKEQIFGIDDKFGEVKKSFKDVFDGVTDIKDMSFEKFSKLAKDFSEDLKDTKNDLTTWLNSLSDSKGEAIDDTILILERQCIDRMNQAQNLLDMNSREYWTKETAELKNNLISIISGTSVLDDSKRKELEEIIMSYEELEFKNSWLDVFLSKDFKGKLVQRLKKMELQYTLNKEMKDNNRKARFLIQENHLNSFNIWQEHLVDIVEAKIIEYSPKLYNKAQLIQEENDKIADYEKKQNDLSYYLNIIKNKMEWQEE